MFPLTLGQLSVWHDIRDLLPHRRHEPNNTVAWPLPKDVDPKRAGQALRAVVARHPSLRTRYDLRNADAPLQLPPDDESRQDLPTVELGAADSGPDTAVGPETCAVRFASEPFDLGREHGWRAQLLTRRGTPTHLLLAKHHIAADAWGQELLRADFLRALSDPAGLGTTAPGPVELATEQHSVTGLKRQAAALDHWARVLGAADPTIALPGADGAQKTVLQGTLRSASAGRAARRVAERTQASVAGVVLAAYARSVARACAADTLHVHLMSANRFSPRWKTLVTSMNQWVPALIERAREDDLATLARSVHWSSLTAVRHGMYDVMAAEQLRTRMPRAAEPACAFNYVAVPDGFPHAVAGTGGQVPPEDPTITWAEPFTTIGPRCYARVVDESGALTIRLTARDISREQAGALLWDLHDALLSAASDPRSST